MPVSPADQRGHHSVFDMNEPHTSIYERSDTSLVYANNEYILAVPDIFLKKTGKPFADNDIWLPDQYRESSPAQYVPACLAYRTPALAK